MRLTLAEEERFVPVSAQTGQNPGYGGDQRLFPSRRQRRNGCGVVAAGNLLCYLGLLSPEPASFEALYRRMRPGPLGAFSLRGWLRRVKKQAAALGAPLRAHSLSSRRSREECERFLSAALRADRPVAALNLCLSPRYEYRWHWITVTGMEEEGGVKRLVISSWGQRRRVDWEDFYRRMHRALFKGGFVWLEKQ